MARITKNYCDKCNAEIAENQSADEFKKCNGARVIAKWVVSGFSADNDLTGQDMGEEESLLCRSCYQSFSSAMQKFFPDFAPFKQRADA